MNEAMERDEKTGIIYKTWVCPSPRAVFLLVHGLGAFSGRWDLLADFFLRNNISSYAIELKGFGETEGLKGHVDSFDIYLSDICLLYEIIKRENSGKNIFLVGESMGGLISFLLVGLKPDLFDGLICLSPAFKNRLKFRLTEKIKIYFGMLFLPRKQFKMPFDSRMCTRDPDCQKAMDTDKREHRLATPRLLFNILLAESRVNSLKEKIKIPVLFLLAGNADKLTVPEEAKAVFKGLKARDKEIIQYPDMYHSLSVELAREKIFEDILIWVSKRI
ncbi:MAG: lysophospholipase [Candidatus Omnitrophota bacterium]